MFKIQGCSNMCYQNMLYQKWHIKLSPTNWPCFLYWLIIVVVNWPSSPLVDRFLNLDILSELHANQTLVFFFVLHGFWKSSKYKYYSLVWSYMLPGIDPRSIYNNHYTTADVALWYVTNIYILVGTSGQLNDTVCIKWYSLH